MSPRNDARFELKTFVVGPMAENCYLVSDPATKEACLIDPGAEPAGIKNYIQKARLNLKCIIITHGHGDHIAACGAFGAPIYIHRLDKDFLKNPDLNMSSSFLFTVTSPDASRLLEDADEVSLSERLKLKVVHTPGHTPGSICVALDGVLFTGDTLFAGGVGRTDFEYGDQDALFRSIWKKVMVFADETVIYPGHGGSSTIGRERRTNPFLT